MDKVTKIGIDAIQDRVNNILTIFNDDEKGDGGYSMVKWLRNRAWEDYNEDRTDWNTLQGYANDMHSMLSDIKSEIEKMKFELELIN